MKGVVEQEGVFLCGYIYINVYINAYMNGAFFSVRGPLSLSPHERCAAGSVANKQQDYKLLWVPLFVDTVLHCCAVLCCTVLYCALRCYSMLRCTVSYALLYCTVRSTVLCRTLNCTVR